MISVLLERSKNGLLSSCKAEGHAGYATKGSDIVCSAVTVLLRTVLRILENTDGIEIETDMHERCYLFFSIKVTQSNPELELGLKYAGKFLETGILSVVQEYPDFVELRYKTV